MAWRAALRQGRLTGAKRKRTGQPEEPVEDKEIRAPLESHGSASAAGDQDAEHDIYAANAICDYPQSGERIIGRQNLQAVRSHHPGKPSGFRVIRILGSGNLWITEYTKRQECEPRRERRHTQMRTRRGRKSRSKRSGSWPPRPSAASTTTRLSRIR